MINIDELLSEMRTQVEYSDKVTMPIPLYEAIKETLRDVQKGRKDPLAVILEKLDKI